MAVSGQELSECTSHLVEYAANRGFSRITQIARIIGGVMVVGGNCLNCDFCDLWDWGSCLNRGFSRIPRMTRIIGGVMVVGF